MEASAALTRTFRVLEDYAGTIQRASAGLVRMVATSATRDAANAAEFVAGVSTILGVAPEVLSGDEDWPCLEPGLLMKRTIATAALVVMPNAGHAINLEDPAAFNRHLADFFQTVDAGRWPTRDPRALTGAILGR